jgi:hypothetical protein
MPQSGDRCSLALHNRRTIKDDSGAGCVEIDIAASVTQLPNREEWLRRKGRDNVTLSGSER